MFDDSTVPDGEGLYAPMYVIAHLFKYNIDFLIPLNPLTPRGSPLMSKIIWPVSAGLDVKGLIKG